MHEKKIYAAEALAHDGSIGLLVADVARQVRSLFDCRSAPLGLTRAEWQILMHLRRRQGMTQSELAGILELKIPSVGRLVHKLIGKGWVEFRVEADDRRNKRLYLSVGMEDLLAEVQLVADSVNESSLMGLSNSETEMLTSLLLRVKANLLAVRDEGVAGVGMEAKG